MTPAEELRAHADAIESGALRWVPRYPTEGECCIGWVVDLDDPDDLCSIGGRAGRVALREATGTEATGFTFDQWNDNICKSPAEAAAMCHKAAEIAERES